MLLGLPVTHYPLTTALFVSIILVLLYSTYYTWHHYILKHPNRTVTSYCIPHMGNYDGVKHWQMSQSESIGEYNVDEWAGHLVAMNYQLAGKI